MLFDIPILLITFNRPDHTYQVLTEILKQEPQDLYICQDGAREGNDLDRIKCQEVRDVISELTSAYATSNKHFTLHTLYQEKNLGCGPGPAAGIDWFFNQVEMGIVMEDDCLPSETLLSFFAELLERYKADSTIALITGTNVLGKWRSSRGDYFISKTGGMTMGAWASWRRAWKMCDFNLITWNNEEYRIKLQKFIGDDEYNVYAPILDEICKQSQNDIWDYQWAYSCWVNGMYRLVASKNQMSNIGFCDEGTHTSNVDDRRANMKLYTCKFPLSIVSNKCDKLFDWVMYQRFTRKTKKCIFLRVFLKILDWVYRK